MLRFIEGEKKKTVCKKIKDIYRERERPNNKSEVKLLSSSYSSPSCKIKLIVTQPLNTKLTSIYSFSKAVSRQLFLS
jgi:hypothetical protein